MEGEVDVVGVGAGPAYLGVALGAGGAGCRGGGAGLAAGVAAQAFAVWGAL